MEKPVEVNHKRVDAHIRRVGLLEILKMVRKLLLQPRKKELDAHLWF
jgi:hypothetical protein